MLTVTCFKKQKNYIIIKEKREGEKIEKNFLLYSCRNNGFPTVGLFR